ncbi:MAG TPA: ComEC/Rec2 family competence protein [Candidatus Paceibacterota bacterium]
MQDRIFYSICFGFAVGVLVRSFVFVNFYFAVFFLFIALILTLFSYFTKLKWGVIASFFILMFSLGIIRFHMVDTPAPHTFESQAGERVELRGEIVDAPDIRENNQKLTILVEEGEEKVKVLATVSFGQDFKYGDEVKFSGKLQKPENFITDQGKEFDYINYLRKDGIYYVMNYVNAEVMSHGNGNKIKSALFYVKGKFIDTINMSIPAPETLLMGGLILGEKASFSDEMRQSFVDTGTIHIVALSGYNVTIVAEWFMQLFKQVPFMSANFSIGAGIFAILLFVIMSGGSSTAVRAGIMATLVLIARATGRNYDVARALMLAGVVMILLNPFVLVYDVSFQLSFIATVAVIFFAPRIEKYFTWVPKSFALRDIVSVTCAAYLFVLPFILYKMGSLSVVALPANILILPFIPFTMLLGFITGFVGLIWYGFSVPMGYISYLFLNYELGVIGFFANIPYAAFSIPNFPLILTLLIYAYFIYRLFGRNIKKFFSI